MSIVVEGGGIRIFRSNPDTFFAGSVSVYHRARIRIPATSLHYDPIRAAYILDRQPFEI